MTRWHDVPADELPSASRAPGCRGPTPRVSARRLFITESAFSNGTTVREVATPNMIPLHIAICFDPESKLASNLARFLFEELMGAPERTASRMPVS